MTLDVVAVAPAVPLLHQIAGFAEVGHHAIRGPLGHSKARRQITQPCLRLIGEEEHRPGVCRQKGPLGHSN